MKKYLFLLILPLLWTSCENESIDTLFDTTPEARTEKSLAGVKDILTAQTNGWIGLLKYNNYQNSAVFHLYFHADGTSTIIFTQNGNRVNHTTTYTLTYTQTVLMVFDTFSIFADLIDTGSAAAFRFELTDGNPARMIWNARNELSAGTLILTPCQSGDAYEQICEIEEMIRGDVNKSFWRVMTLHGDETLYSFHYSVNAVFEWNPTGEEIHQAAFNVETDEKGFTLEQPFQAGGIRVNRFEYRRGSDNFEVYDTGGNKVGQLGYSLKKPFDFPGSVKGFMNTVGVRESNLIISPIGYSAGLYEGLRTLEQFWGDTVMLMGFQRQGDVLGFMFIGDSPMRHVKVETTLGDSYVDFYWNGIAPDCWDGTDEGREKFLEAARPFLDNFGNNRGLGEVRWNVVPRSGLYFFVQEKDPSNSFVAKAMTSL